ncbi:hypothetical protein Tco_0158535 [Tanacetum coccineum]
MGIVVSTIHRAIKFHTPRGIGTVFSTNEPYKIEEGKKKLKEAPPKASNGVLRCADTEEKIEVKDQTWVANPVMVKKSDRGATYQMLVDKIFSDQIIRNLEAYMDDMLNPEKCSFGVEEGPFLGHFITKQEIRVNPSKVKAVTNLESPKTLKDVQSLNRKLAALSRFLSKGAEKSLPFFKALKSCTDKKTIQWTTDVEEAFRKMKKFVEILPTLTAPIKGEVLVMYLAASTVADSTRNGNKEPSHLRRLSVNGQPNKGTLRSKADCNQAIFRKSERSPKGFRHLRDRAYSKKLE